MRTLVIEISILLALCAAVLSLDCDYSDTITKPEGPAYALVPEQLDLATAIVGGPAVTGMVSVQNLRNGDLVITRFDGDCPAEVTWEPPADTIGKNGSTAFAIRFAPERPYDRRSCSLKPSIEGMRSDDDPSLSVSYAAGEAACALAPDDTLDFGEVPIGNHGDLTLTLRNTTPDAVAANQFRYRFGNPSGRCDLFAMDPADTVGVIGPAGARDIVVRFTPDAASAFECRRDLASLRVSEDAEPPSLHLPCPGQVVWRGTGVVPPVQWSACLPGGSTDWQSIFGLSSSEIHVAGEGGSVLASGGDCQWQGSGTGFSSVDLRDIWVGAAGADRNLWAVGNILPAQGTTLETGVILRSDGSTWSKVDEWGFLTYRAVWGSELDDVYFAGLGIATDFPNAKRWNGRALDTLHISEWGMSAVTGVSGTAANDVWAVLGQSFASVFRFQGGAWESQAQPFMTRPLHDVWAVQGTGFYAVVAVGEDGAIYHFDGTTWTDESISGETRDFYGVWVSATGRVFVVGEDQVIYRGHVDDPTEWALQSPPPGLPAGDLRDVWGAADDDVFAVGTNGVILRFAPAGEG